MSRAAFAVLWVSASVTLCACSYVDRATLRSDADARTVVDGWMKEHAIPGVAVVIYRDGHPVLQEGYGYADLRQHTRVTPRTRFAIASISKQFTAAAIVALLSRRAISLMDQIPPTKLCPQGYGPVRYLDLIQHTAGYREERDFEGAAARPFAIARLKMLCGSVRRAAVFAYRNDNYIILSDVIETLTDEPLSDVVSRSVFKPSGMRDASFASRPGDAVGYDCTTPAVRPLPDDTLGALGAGGVRASARDLAAWDNSLLAGRFPVSLPGDPATGPVRLGNDHSYGLGFEIIDDAKRGQVILHEGASRGFSSINAVFMARGISVAILANCDHLIDLRDLVYQLYGLVS